MDDVGGTGGRDLSGQLDRFGNLSVEVVLGGGPGAARRETGASAKPATVAQFLRDLAADVERAARPAQCCDLHGRNCEPPGDLCCRECTEARHGFWTDERGVRHLGHPRGEQCSNPILSGTGL